MYGFVESFSKGICFYRCYEIIEMWPYGLVSSGVEFIYIFAETGNRRERLRTRQRLI